MREKESDLQSFQVLRSEMELNGSCAFSTSHNFTILSVLNMVLRLLRMDTLNY